MAGKVLIIEDDFIIQMFIENIVRNIGCEVVGVVDNSDSGLESIQKDKPDLILMDVGICGKTDGIETAEIINEKYIIPIVFITGNSDPLTIKRIEAARPLHIIKKPIDEEKMTAELIYIVTKLNL